MLNKLATTILFIFKYFFSKNIFTIKLFDSLITIRPRNFDFFIVLEVFFLNSYIPKLLPLKKTFDTVVDLGANIGTFSIWFFKKYKYKKMVCVEPVSSNFQLLKDNVSLNKVDNVTLLNNAIYNKNCNIEMTYPLRIKKTFRNDGMNQLEENEKGTVKAFTFQKILKSQKINKIDFLKMDIEGAEKYILTSENENIFKEKVEYVILEAHDYLGYKKELAYNYFTNLGFKVKYRKSNNVIPNFSNCVVIEALNENLINK